MWFKNLDTQLRKSAWRKEKLDDKLKMSWELNEKLAHICSLALKLIADSYSACENNYDSMLTAQFSVYSVHSHWYGHEIGS